MNSIQSSILVLLLAAPLAAADSVPPPTIHDQIVVTASALPEHVDQTPAAVTVITREQIEARAARDVADVLREVPGLVVVRSGSPGKVASLFTRGGSSKQTLVLWNGIELNNPYFAGFDFGRLSTAGVERIEVVRGPYSALYGSDAVSGVVNILTSPRDRFFTADVQGGGNGLRNGRVAGGGGVGAWRASGAVEVRRDDGFAPNDDLEQETASAEARWSPSARGSIALRARVNRYELGTPRSVNADGTAFEPRLRRRESGDELELALPVELVLGRSHLELVVSRNERTDEFEDPEDPFGRTWASTDVLIRRASALSRVPFGRQTVVGGAEWEEAIVDDASAYGTSLDRRERTSKSLFLEDRATVAAGRGLLEASVGIRWDEFDTFGSELSPRAAVAWLVGRTKLRAGYGEAFRAPAVGELYFPFFGNAELEPERSASWELGWEREIRGGRIAATLFRNEFDELIVYDNVTNRFENVGAGVSDGIELGWTQRIGRTVGLTASYTWLDTEDADTGEPFLRRPEHSGSLSIRWADGGWSVGGVVLHTGERADLTDLVPFGRVWSEAYTTVDLVVERSMGTITPYVKLENATDTEYEEIFGYPSPGRRAIAGVRFELAAGRAR